MARSRPRWGGSDAATTQPVFSEEHGMDGYPHRWLALGMPLLQLHRRSISAAGGSANRSILGAVVSQLPDWIGISAFLRCDPRYRVMVKNGLENRPLLTI